MGGHDFTIVKYFKTGTADLTDRLCCNCAIVKT